MALRATNIWRSMVVGLAEKRSFATSTNPKLKPISQNLHDADEESAFNRLKKFYLAPRFIPVWVVVAFLPIPILIGIHSLKQQIVHAPSVYFDKTKRASLHEVDDPDVTIGSSDKFINKSFLRKIAHIQDPGTPVIPDTLHPDPFTRYLFMDNTCISAGRWPRTAQTLKTAGVDPSRR